MLIGTIAVAITETTMRRTTTDFKIGCNVATFVQVVTNHRLQVVTNHRLQVVTK
jgi:hypothetical protein